MTGDPQLPPFLYGSFDWRFNGLFWESAPPFDLLSDRALADPSPWVVVASVVERAKHGDHREAKRLREFFERDQPVALARISLLAFADTAPLGDLPLLEEALRSPIAATRVHAAAAGALTGSLTLIPAMLRAWEAARSLNDHESIGFALSEVLEPQGGPIAESVGSYDLLPSNEPLTPAAAEAQAFMDQMYRDVDPPVLPQHVRAALAEHTRAFGERTSLWRGVPYDIRALAQELLDIARENRTHVIYDLRHRFEASTGLDCRSMLYALRLQPLAIAAIIERFLQSSDAAKFQRGVRYFWGHRIPE
jgi:hypothetical protein